MADIVGSIRSAVTPLVTEAPGWEEPCRILIVKDVSGRRHGRIEWLESEVDEEFLQRLAVMATTAMREASDPSRSDASAS